ncbi:MAG: PepSY domain-containing protein [Actinobacteria bacterium]|nr:MAG: PepSY domain-containing protein [Actinomycetota bacterium]
MFRLARKTLISLAALAALAVGGATFANAASTNTTSSQSAAPPSGAPRPGGAPGRHVGANGQQEQPLTGDTATKVKEAALAKVGSGTVERVETDVDHGSPYEAHIRRSDGTELEVLVSKDFQVTAVNTMGR